MSYIGQPCGFGMNGRALYTNVAKPIAVNLQFVVTPTNGLGVTSLKSNGHVNNVFMHTSTTPTANNGFTNPNPAVGYAWIQLKNNFNYFLSSLGGFIAKNSGSDVKVDNSALTVGQVYVITTLGNSTTAQWVTLGVPVGVTPAVGVSFVALLVGIAGEANTSTSRVQVPSTSGISSMEVVGTTNTMINTGVSSNAGEWVMVQFLAPAFTGATFTPAGTINAQTFTGSALASHNHNLTVIGGQAGSTTNDIADYAGPLLGKEAATNSTYLGANSATNGGVVGASAGTPAGTITQATFTGTGAAPTGTMSFAVAAPATASIVFMSLLFDGSSVTVDGL